MSMKFCKMMEEKGGVPRFIGRSTKGGMGMRKICSVLLALSLLFSFALAEDLAGSWRFIGGGELLAIGFSGRAVGRAKQRLLDEVASERLANEHGALVRRAERLYRSGWRGETDGRE